ncbi:hypothetical protein LCGC14_0143060 [marine sediment metagenome]|uniref:Uncharacterized protein n=1 Tax=marine sediment metagenome TaxID=412755 RepID=A0A0F9V4Y2_9ZZZZ
MIEKVEKGDLVIVRTMNGTKEAIYQPCTVLETSERNITVEYCAGTDKNGSGKIKTETISRRDIVSLQLRA